MSTHWVPMTKRINTCANTFWDDFMQCSVDDMQSYAYGGREIPGVHELGEIVAGRTRTQRGGGEVELWCRLLGA